MHHATLNIEGGNAALGLVSLGEVMLRLDPGDERVSTTRQFRAWEGGGEYNVARGLRRCFGLSTAIVTALADNPVGRLVEDFMLQGGVGSKVCSLGALRRSGAHRPQRPEFHRARIRSARCRWVAPIAATPRSRN